MRPNEFRSGVPKTARRQNESAIPTRGTSVAIICRDYAAFEAELRTLVSKNCVEAVVSRTKLIIRAQLQNNNSAILATHISIAKIGWLGVAQARKDILHEFFMTPIAGG
jgi:hypothetical protein